MGQRRQSLVAAGVLFVCGATGSAASTLSDGSLIAAIASILGYCGAGYYVRDYTASATGK